MELTLQSGKTANHITSILDHNPCFYGINFAIGYVFKKQIIVYYHNPCFYGINFAIVVGGNINNKEFKPQSLFLWN